MTDDYGHVWKMVIYLILFLLLVGIVFSLLIQVEERLVSLLILKWVFIVCILLIHRVVMKGFLLVAL